MLTFLARHEWRLLSSSAVVRLVLVLFGAALLVASLLGAARAARDRQTYDAFTARRMQQRSHTSSGRADVIANDTGAVVLMPPAPLGALAVGQSDVYPSFIKVTARALDSLVTGDQIEHPLAVASGHFDAAFVILFLYPLLIFAVSFDLTATERDRGTLRMVLSQPVAIGDLVSGKIVARAALLGLPVLVIPLIGSAGAPVTLAVMWTLAVVAYGSIWHGLALIVNARGWNAAANALVLAGIWLMFTVVGPATINLVIALRYPMPSRVAAAVQARAATQEATVQGSRELGQFLQDHPTSANVGREGMRQFAMLQAARDRQIAERLQAVESAFDAQLQRQQRLASWLSMLSPTMIAQQVLLETAGTSATRFDHFAASAAEYQRAWRAYFEPRVLDAATLTATEIGNAPAFTYTEPPVSAQIRNVAPAVAAMGLVGAVLLGLGFRLYRGYTL